MKARRKGTNEPYQKVASVCLCSGGYILIKDVEFEQPTSDHWQDVRERAAIAVLPQCLKIVQDEYKHIMTQTILSADDRLLELVEKAISTRLKEVEQEIHKIE